ncbi:MAG: hypothetical protein AAF184_22470 [Pseudomonadota bacterium]
MQVYIDKVVNQFRAMSTSSALAPETLAQIVAAVSAALREEQQREARVEEEGSLRNYQERTRSWER